MSRSREKVFSICLLATMLSAGSWLPADAQVFYATSSKYLTGQDPYAEQPLGVTGEVWGTNSVSLDHTEPGPLGGTFGFSGAAEATAGALKTRAAVDLTAYPLGSFYNVDAPTYDYLPISGSAYATVRDQVRINGTDPTYNLEFTYRLTGQAARGAGNYEYYFRPTVAAAAWLQSPESGLNLDFESVAFYPENGHHDSIVTFTLADIPSNVTLNLHQFMQILLYSADSVYQTDIDPFQTGDWDPSHILGETSLIGEDPYSVSVSADFSHTLELQDVTLRDGSGSVATGAWLFSENGVQYPGQPIPEPATCGLLCLGACTIALWRRRHCWLR